MFLVAMDLSVASRFGDGQGQSKLCVGDSAGPEIGLGFWVGVLSLLGKDNACALNQREKL